MVSPHLLMKLTHCRYELSADLSELTRLIKMDPALCFQAMRMDRCMGCADHNADVPLRMDATIDRIGMAGVDAIIARTLADQVLDSAHHQRGQALEWLWRHALTTALLAHSLAKESDPEEAYIAGLLHGIGKLALLARTPPACTPMLADPALAVSLLEAEEQVAGLGQDRIGADLLRRFTHAWSAADAAAFHTAAEGQIRQAFPLVQIIWAASRLALAPWPVSPTHHTVSALLGIDPLELERISQAAEARIRAVSEELGLTPSPPLPDRPTAEEPDLLIRTTQTRTALAHVYRELLHAGDLTSVWRVLRQSLSAFLGIEAVMVFDHSPRDGCLVVRLAAGIAAPQAMGPMRIPQNASDCLPVACHTSETMVDTFSHARQKRLTIIDRQLLAALGTDGFVCLPLRSGNAGGCLVVGIEGSDWPWNPQQKTLLAAIAAAADDALTQAGLRVEQAPGPSIDQDEAVASGTRKIVHEINNPLGIIKNYLKVVARRVDQEQPVGDHIRIINEEIDRVGTLVRSLTAPSGRIADDRKIVDVNATIKDILNLFQDGLPEEAGIQIHQDLDTRIPRIQANRSLLKQALVNLLKNATEAMPDGGIITVRTRMLLGVPCRANRPTETEIVKISICDDGPGIDEGIRNRLFKPHATSKAGHDGLGLAIVQEAISHLNGTLLCESAPGRGTCFHIELPATENGF